MNTVDILPDAPTHPRVQKRGGILMALAMPIVGVLALVSAPALTDYVTHRVEDIVQQRKLAAEARQKRVRLSLIRQEKDSFLQSHVDPLLQATLTKNHEALARARGTLANAIDRYGSGIEPFIRDLRSWSTEFGVVTKSISGWWWADGRFDLYMREKFAAHLFTDASITADIGNARRQLQEDLEANQNQLLTELANASTYLKVGEPPAWPDRTAFAREISAQARGGVEHNVVVHEVRANAIGMIVPVVVDVAVRAAAKAAASRASGVVLATAARRARSFPSSATSSGSASACSYPPWLCTTRRRGPTRAFATTSLPISRR
jgi:hypothetical protein